MAIDGLSTGLLVAVAQKLVTELAQRGIEAVRGGPVEQAIVDTQASFTDVEVGDHLRTWTQSEAFRDLLNRFVTGAPSQGHNQIVDSFLEVTDFFLPEDKRRDVASAAVAVFFQALHRRLLLSPEGAAIAAARDEALHLQGQALTARTLAEVREVRALVAGDAAESLSVVGELNAKIDAARELLRVGKPASARGLLVRIRDSLTPESDRRIWMRVEANLAAAALALDDADEARTRYGAALQYGQESRVFAIGAQVELRLGDDSRGLELARSSWEAEAASHSAAVLLMSLTKAGADAEVEQLRKSNLWIDTDPPCLAVLGVAALQREDLPTAIMLLRRSMAGDTGNARVRVQLAMALIASVQHDVGGEPPLPWMMDPSLLARLDEAEGLLTSAAADFLDQEPRDSHLEAIALRAAARMMLRRNSDAVADADYVLHQKPDHYSALRTKGFALLGTDSSGATSALDAAWTLSQEEGTVGFALAHALRASGQPDSARTLLVDLRGRSELSIDGQIAAMALLGEVLHDLGDPEGAAAIKEELLNTWADNPSAHVAVASIERAQGQLETSISHLQAGLGLATGNLRSQIAFELADGLLAAGRFDEASTLLESLVDDTAPLSARQRYAASLFNAGRLREALAFASRQRSGDAVVPIITEVEAAVLVRIGDVAQARGLYERLADQTGQPAFRLQAAALAIQDGDVEGARSMVAAVSEADIRSDSYQLMQLAQLRQATGLPDALPPAYRARRLAYGDPTIHMAYVSVFLHRGAADATSLSPEVIGPGVTASLRGSAGTMIVRIEDDEPDRSRGDLPSNDELAVRLLGAAAGDQVVVRDDGIERVVYEVAELRSKYVEAFQDTLANFATLFPGRTDLRSISVAEGDLGGVFRLLDRQHSSITQILDMYRSRRAPIGMVARLLGQDPIDVARAVRREADLLIPVSTGELGDISQELDAAALSVLVLDEPALVTIDDLGLWTVIEPMFERLLVPHQIVERIRASLATSDELAPTGFLGKTDTGYFMRDISSDQIAAERASRERLLQNIDRHAAVSAPQALLELGAATLAELEATIGSGTLAAIHLARGEAAVLWTDDLATRLLARDEWAVRGTWTQPILRRALRDRVVDRARYASALAEMAGWGFVILVPEPEDLLAILEADAGQLDASTIGALSMFLGRNYSQDFSVGLAARVLRGVFLMVIPPERRALLVDLILTSLTKGRPAGQVLDALTRELPPLVRLMPLAEAELARIIQLWMGRPSGP